MPEKTIEEILSKFNESDYTVKLCNIIFKAIPGLQPFQFYNTIEGATERIAGGDASVLAKAKEIATTSDIKTAVWVTDAVDKADMGISVLTGVKNLMSIFGKNKGQSTIEADPQQAIDAAMKAAALSYIIYKIMPGAIGEKITHFRELPAGNELAAYYAMAEVALPFTDNLISGGAALISRLFSQHSGDMNTKFSSIVGGEGMKQAGQVLEKFQGPLAEYVDMAKDNTGTVMAKVRDFLPSAATIGNVADSATGVAAMGMDVMPVWSFLGSRLVAEACVYRAQKGL